MFEQQLGEKVLNYGSGNNLVDAINSTISFFWNIAIVLVIVYLAVSGVKFLTSAGDKAKVESATNAIKYSIIALLILLFLNLVVYTFIPAIFGGGSSNINNYGNLDQTEVN